MDIRRIDDELSVSPQISADDISAIAQAGYRAIVCNRPDGEAADQPLHELVGVDVRCATCRPSRAR